MRKIGLISFHKDPNYGTMYQAYALAKAIEKLGCVAEYIEYEPIQKRSIFITVVKKIVKRILSVLGLYKGPITEYSFFKSKEFKVLKSKYRDFHQKYIPTSKNTYYANTIFDSENAYDLFIVGSDQTWSSFCNTNINTPNYLSFIKDSKKKRAYAPSLGSVHITDEYKKKLRLELSDFEYLSCREYENSKMLSVFLNKEVKHVLDPTLLLSSDEWSFIEQPIKMPEHYVLCYILGTKKCISDFAEKLGQTKGYPVYYIVTRPEYFSKKNALKDVAPEQFLYLLRNASYVVTDSFHGSVFSVNFNRNFYSFAKRETKDSTGIDNDRIMDFLSLLGLQNRFIYDNEMRLEEDICFSEINKIVKLNKESSIKYLKSIIF